MIFSRLRDEMVDIQIAGRGIRDRRLLLAMRQVPRELFVDGPMQEHAYDDSALPIGQGQTISQPYIVALMIEAAEVGPGQRVLEIGAGSGYAAAILGRIADRVFAVERHDKLALEAAERLRKLGYANVRIQVGDGAKGLQDEAPFDAILVSAAGSAVPEALKVQLVVGGRLVMPVGSSRSQALRKFTRLSEREFEEENLGPVRFVPLITDQDSP